MSSGWIKLHRSLLEWEWFTEPHTCHLFTYLILAANHRDGSYRGTPVKRGQLITGRQSLSERTGLSEKQVRTALKRLVGSSEIATEASNRYTLITVMNYDKYQQLEPVQEEEKADEGPTDGPAKGQPEGQQRANKGPAKGQPEGHKQEEKKNKNKKNERRKEEELREETIVSSCPESEADSRPVAADCSSPCPSLPPEDPLICTLPLTGDGTFAVHQSFVDEVAPLYPAVDVVQALRSMKGWLVGNPKKRKTRRGITRFITGWLEREQNNSSCVASRASPAITGNTPGGPYAGYPTKNAYVRSHNKSVFDELRDEE